MSERTLAIAHRAGNEPGLLADALVAGADIAEADIWPYRGRLEVRHLKTMGRVPLLWDRWKLAPAWAPRFLMDELLGGLPEGIGLMLDLKGHDVAGAKQVAEVSGELADEGRLYVCARDWAMLEPFAGTNAILVHSAGTPREMALLESKVQSGEATAVSVHQKLLGPEVVQRLRESARLLMAWPVNDVAKMRELVSWGVNGITTDSLAVVRAMKGG